MPQFTRAGDCANLLSCRLCPYRGDSVIQQMLRVQIVPLYLDIKLLMLSSNKFSARVPESLAGNRLDQVAAQLFPAYSRARIQTWIKSGNLLIDGSNAKAHAKVLGGELLEMTAVQEEEGAWLPEEIPLAIVYEDEDIIVINKPAGLVVHPAAGNWSGTLLNALLFYHKCLFHIPRGGIVHRLDKDTSGLMVVAKTLTSQHHLVKQLQSRTVTREYRAIVYGNPPAEGRIEAPIGRHPRVRTRMAVVSKGGKEAVTHFQVLSRQPDVSCAKLRLETGRTHQIRVHMTHIGYPLVGDTTYFNAASTSQLSLSPHKDAVSRFPRQALHASRLSLLHPGTGKNISWSQAMPEDMQNLLKLLGLSSSESGVDQGMGDGDK